MPRLLRFVPPFVAWLLMVGILCSTLVTSSVSAAEPLRALIIDGQNNHDWRATTPILKQHLEASGRSSVEVATAPEGTDLSSFQPKFDQYDVVVSNYNGALWSTETQQALVAFVKAGGGFVAVHAANNAFPEWPEYNQMIGVGGWGGRNEKSGPYLRLRNEKFTRDTSPGNGGSHGQQHAFAVVTRQPEHPIMRGLPPVWMHAQDELYDRLRGPAENLQVLASAFADSKTGGSGEEEPMLMAIDFGQGRVFHTTLGHSVEAMQCVGFIVTLQRGTEWAATGKVTLNEIPADFPSSSTVSQRKP